ncbi:MAG: LytTR family DNA-binding domain-containing protein [Ferruginibacter sp.]
MQVIIIEDEILTAEYLESILSKMPYQISVLKILPSVKDAVKYLQQQPFPDLIFCDIQLGDGHSFEIFKQVDIETPVIFCTAYNEYALKAFDNNGIGYVLKPFSENSIKEAIDKFIMLRGDKQATPTNINRLSAEQLNNTQPSSILVNWKDKILPVKIADTALFCIEYRATKMITKNNNDYSIGHNLDELEQMCGTGFYRANRQYLINRSAIEEVQQYSSRKLFVKLSVKGDFDITIAKAKVPEFLNWLKA